MTRRSVPLAAFAAIAVLACSTPSAPPPAAPAPAPAAGVATINSADLKRDLYAFADDSMLGRDAETGDAVRAARWIAAHAEAAGLEPAGDSGGYLQRVPLVREFLGRSSQVTVTTRTGTLPMAIGPQLLPVLSLGENTPLPRLVAEGDVVFAGYGVQDGTGKDYLANQSVAGKVVVFVMGAPPSLDSAARVAMERAHPLAERIAMMVERGPAAVVAVVSGRAAALMPAVAADLRDSAVHLGDGMGAAQRGLPMVLLCDVRAANLLLPVGWPGKDAKPGAVAARHLSANVDLIRREVPGYNVVALRRGADSALRGTYVAFGAHLDHIGIQRPENGDSIANGADDDGSGTVALLAIARAAVTQKAPAPRRSMLFVWHTGEELGLYGSEWFTSHPTVPLDSIVAQLNADMIGRNGPDSLYIVGPVAAPHRQSYTLGLIVDQVNASLPRPFTINREWDSPTHPEQIYYRSDHYNYARNGIPVVFFTSGLHADYHKVTDSPDKIDYAKLARVAAFIYDVGLAVSERPSRLLTPAAGN